MLAALADDARMPNAQLASVLGIAPSTAHQRMRSLVERGVIAGFHTSVDQSALGHELQALVGVTLRPGARETNITTFRDAVRDMPEVLQVFFVGGADDFMVHVAVAGSSELRAFIIALSAQQSVANTRTSIVFDYTRNAVVAPFS